MKQNSNFKISFEEASLRGLQIIAHQSATSYVQALAQVQRLKETSKVSSSLKKNRSRA
jgi:hypothetical protein